MRSAVSTTMAPVTPGIALTAVSAAARMGSKAAARSAGTEMENITRPLATTMSETMPRRTMSRSSSGPRMLLNRLRTACLSISGMEARRSWVKRGREHSRIARRVNLASFLHKSETRQTEPTGCHHASLGGMMAGTGLGGARSGWPHRPRSVHRSKGNRHAPNCHCFACDHRRGRRNQPGYGQGLEGNPRGYGRDLSALRIRRRERRIRRLRHRHPGRHLRRHRRQVHLRQPGFRRHHPGPARRQVRRHQFLDLDHGRAREADRLHRHVLQHAAGHRCAQGRRHQGDERGRPRRQDDRRAVLDHPRQLRPADLHQVDHQALSERRPVQARPGQRPSRRGQ